MNEFNPNPLYMILIQVSTLGGKKSQESLEKAINDNPNDHVAWKELGNYYLDLDQMDEARRCYLKSISINETYPNAHYNMAVTYYKERNYEECLTHVGQTLMVDPKFVDAYYLKGVVEINIHKHDEAIATLTSLIKMKSDDENYYFMRGNAKAFKWERASEQTAWNQSSGPLSLYSELFKYQFNLDMLREAVKDYEIAYSINNDHSGTTFNLGYAYKRLSILEEAETMLRKTIHLDPENQDAYDLLVQVLILRKKLDEAKKFAEQGVTLGISQLSVYLNQIDHYTGNSVNKQVDTDKISVEKTYQDKIEEFYNFLVKTDIIYNDTRRDLRAKLTGLLTGTSNPFHQFIHDHQSLFSQYVKIIIVHYDKMIRKRLDYIRQDRHSDGEERYDARHTIYKSMVPFFSNFDHIDLITEIAKIPYLTNFSLGEFIKYLTISLDIPIIFNALKLAPSNSKSYIVVILERTDFSEVKSELKDLLITHFSDFQKNGESSSDELIDDLKRYLELYSQLARDEREEIEFKNILHDLLNRRKYVKRKLLEGAILTSEVKRREKLSLFEKKEKELIISAIRSVGNAKYHSFEDLINMHMDIDKTAGSTRSWDENYRYLISFWEIDVYVIACFKALVKLQTQFGLYGLYQILKIHNTDLNYNTYINSDTGILTDSSLVKDFAYWLEEAIQEDNDEMKFTAFGNFVFGVLMYNDVHLETKVKNNIIFLLYCISYLVLDWPIFIELITRNSMKLNINISFLFHPNGENLEYQTFITKLIENNMHLFSNFAS